MAHDGGPKLREVVAAADVRPRPPPPPPGHEVRMFDLVEAFHRDGWWLGVVSGIRKKEEQCWYAVSFPRFREVVEQEASLVRPRREFLRGRWMDAHDEVSGFWRMESMEACFILYIQISIKMHLQLQNHLVNLAQNNLILDVIWGSFCTPKQGHKTFEFH